MARLLVAVPALFAIACSPQPAERTDAPVEAAARPVPPAESAPRPVAPPPPREPAADRLTLDGLGALRIGQPVPAGSGWAERGAQISDECRTISSPEFPGAYAIVEDGKVRRITLGERSDIRLAEGIGPGSPETAVRAAFPGLRQSPHAYADPPAKYLTAPDAAGGGPALRFEINADGRVGLVHAGTMPVLEYVEGCA